MMSREPFPATVSKHIRVYPARFGIEDSNAAILSLAHGSPAPDVVPDLWPDELSAALRPTTRVSCPGFPSGDTWGLQEGSSLFLDSLVSPIATWQTSSSDGLLEDVVFPVLALDPNRNDKLARVRPEGLELLPSEGAKAAIECQNDLTFQEHAASQGFPRLGTGGTGVDSCAVRCNSTSQSSFDEGSAGEPYLAGSISRDYLLAHSPSALSTPEGSHRGSSTLCSTHDADSHGAEQVHLQGGLARDGGTSVESTGYRLGPDRMPHLSESIQAQAHKSLFQDRVQSELVISRFSPPADLEADRLYNVPATQPCRDVAGYLGIDGQLELHVADTTCSPCPVWKRARAETWQLDLSHFDTPGPVGWKVPSWIPRSPDKEASKDSATVLQILGSQVTHNAITAKLPTMPSQPSCPQWHHSQVAHNGITAKLPTMPSMGLQLKEVVPSDSGRAPALNLHGSLAERLSALAKSSVTESGGRSADSGAPSFFGREIRTTCPARRDRLTPAAADGTVRPMSRARGAWRNASVPRGVSCFPDLDPPSTKHSEVLMGRMMRSAEALEHNDLPAFDSLSQQLRSCARREGLPIERLVHYVLQGLTLRRMGHGRRDLSEPIRKSNSEVVQAAAWFTQAGPVMPFYVSFTVATLFDQIKGKECAHVVDLGAAMVPRWHLLLDQFRQNPGVPRPRQLRITMVNLSPVLHPRRRPIRSILALKQYGIVLKEAAAKVGIDLEFERIDAEERAWQLLQDGIMTSANESLVVCTSFHWMHVPERAGVGKGDSPKDWLLRWFRVLNPEAVLVVEAEMDASSSMPFLSRLRSCMDYYYAFLELDESLSTQASDRTSLRLFEELFLGCHIVNIVSCDGDNLLMQPEAQTKLFSRFAKAGFESRGVKKEIVDSISANAVTNRQNCSLILQPSSVALAWRSRILVHASVWVPAPVLS